MRKGMNMSVMMPYADSLKLISDWYAQLWAESLGKNLTLDGKALPCRPDTHQGAGRPPTSIRSSSSIRRARSTSHHLPARGELPRHHAHSAWLRRRAHHRLPRRQEPQPTHRGRAPGTEYAVYRSGHVSQTITLPTVCEETIGQLLYFLELVTAYAGALLNIDAFNQPGVEESKVASYAVMGYESEKHSAKREEMKKRPASNSDYIF